MMTCAYCNNTLYSEEEKRTGTCDDCTTITISYDDAWEDIGHTPPNPNKNN